MKFRAAVATAAVLPLALGLAACGSNAKPDAGSRPSVSVPTTAEPQKAVSTPPPAVVRLNRVTFVPAMKAAMAKQKSWHLTGKMTAEGKTLLSMDGYQTVNPLAMKLTMSGGAFAMGTGPTTVLLVKGVMYLQVPGQTPAGKFVKIDDAFSGDMGELVKGGDPTKIFQSFDKSMANVKFVGKETIGGKSLDRYDVTVNTAKAFSAQGKKAMSGLPKTLVYKIWLDEAHAVSRMTFQLAGATMVMTMSDYNKPVSITAPPANKIVK